jgi:alkanesulfonate monooxygenase SsuD/methylene tetrahydromethanopterin reductase-like flavin-dependent oxidoreductase (luciferase family)
MRRPRCDVRQARAALALGGASIEQIAGGRFLFGTGGARNAEEMADHGTEFRTRFKPMRERIAAMKTIWTKAKAKAEYRGDMVDFPEMMT